jgi:hypothetical protein
MDVWMLLKTIGTMRNVNGYPTMFMIIHGLISNLNKAVSCFQYDSLWKNLKIGLKAARTHDVYDQKWVSAKYRKSGLLFSIGYLQENSGNCTALGAKPTMCMVGKDLRSNRGSLAISYVIENRTRSSLAPKRNALRTHDVYEEKWFNPKWRFLNPPSLSPCCSLYVASR